MSEQLRNMLVNALAAHGLSPVPYDGWICIHDLAFKADARIMNADADGTVVQVAFGITASALEGRVLWCIHAGFGADEALAMSDGFAKFLIGPFHVLLSALENHSCTEGSEAWQNYTARDGHVWRLCDSALVMQGFDDPESVPFAGVQHELVDAFLNKASRNVHWVDVFFAFVDGKQVAIDVGLDGEPWPEGAQILRSWDYVPGTGYSAGRYFFIALRQEQSAEI